jgi:hypothetical protein
MSREFIDAIASGNNLEAEDEFKNSISSKVGDALEFRRKELSQNFAGNNEGADLEEAGWENLNKVLDKKDISHTPDPKTGGIRKGVQFSVGRAMRKGGSLYKEPTKRSPGALGGKTKETPSPDGRWRPPEEKRELARQKSNAAKGAELAKSGIGSKPSRMSPGAMGGDEDTPAKWKARLAANRKSGKLDDFTGKAKEKMMARKAKKPSAGPSTDDEHLGP